MIPKEIIEQWEIEAQMNSTLDTYVAESEEDVYERGYIKGRTDQYLQMQAEIERLKGLVEDAYNLGYHVRMECEDKTGNEKSFIKATSFNKFKKHHNL